MRFRAASDLTHSRAKALQAPQTHVDEFPQFGHPLDQPVRLRS
jgi:hypothetical protein